MIPKISTLLWMGIIASAIFGLYMVKYRVQELQKESASLTRELEEERENLHVIAAEWAFLNRPERIQALAEKHLKLVPMHGEQLGEVAMLPYAGQSVASADAAPLRRASSRAKENTGLQITPAVLQAGDAE